MRITPVRRRPTRTGATAAWTSKPATAKTGGRAAATSGAGTARGQKKSPGTTGGKGKGKPKKTTKPAPPAPASGGGLPRDGLTAPVSVIRACVDEMAMMRSQLGVQDLTDQESQDLTLDIDPQATTIASAFLNGAQPVAPGLLPGAGVDPVLLGNRLDQEIEMEDTYLVATGLSGQVNDSWQVVALTEKKMATALVNLIRKKLADPNLPDDVRATLTADSMDLLAKFDQMAAQQVDTRQKGQKAAAAGEAQVSEQDQRTQMLNTMIALRRGVDPSTLNIKQAAATYDSLVNSGGSADTATAAGAAPVSNRRDNARV